MFSQAGHVKIISDSELKAVTTVIVIDDMFDTCGHSAFMHFHAFRVQAV
jgi:hypothetical protein